MEVQVVENSSQQESRQNVAEVGECSRNVQNQVEQESEISRTQETQVENLGMDGNAVGILTEMLKNLSKKMDDNNQSLRGQIENSIQKIEAGQLELRKRLENQQQVLEIFREQVTGEIGNVRKEVSQEIENSEKRIFNRVTEKSEKENRKLREEVAQTLDKERELARKELEENMSRLEIAERESTRQRRNLEEITDQIKEVAIEVTGVKEKLENLRINGNVSSSINVREVTARNEARPNASADISMLNMGASTSSNENRYHCVDRNGGPNMTWPNHILSEIIPPIFENEDSDDPKAFIGELQEYLAVKRIPEEYKMTIVRKCFKGNAANWLDLSMGNSNDFGTFINLFLNRYWGANRQGSIRLELSNGKFNPRIDKSMVNYFMKVARKSKMLDPPINEKDLINMVTTHFPETIQNYIIIAKPSSVAAMIDLLLALESNKTKNDLDSRNQGRNERENTNSFGQGAQFYQNRNNGIRDRYRGPVPRIGTNQWENRGRNQFDRENRNQNGEGRGRHIRINYMNTDRYDRNRWGQQFRHRRYSGNEYGRNEYSYECRPRSPRQGDRSRSGRNSPENSERTEAINVTRQMVGGNQNQGQETRSNNGMGTGAISRTQGNANPSQTRLQ